MRIGSRIAACLVVAFYAGVLPADFTRPPIRPPAPATLVAPRPAFRPARLPSFESLAAEVDNRVLANLLTDAPPWRANDFPLSVVAGEISRCEEDTCTVPLSVRVFGTEGPVMLTFAVANPKGELSDVHHAECGTGACSVSLVLERGANTISVGVTDAMANASACTTLRVNADHVMAKKGRTEWF